MSDRERETRPVAREASDVKSKIRPILLKSLKYQRGFFTRFSKIIARYRRSNDAAEKRSDRMSNDELTNISPGAIYRMEDCKAIFGFSITTLKEKIEAGIVPKPIRLSPPPGRGRGWLGSTIIEYREKLLASQEEWAANAKNFYVPAGGDVRKAKPAAAAKPTKLKGLKRPAKKTAGRKVEAA
jgi:hypothetical protein